MSPVTGAPEVTTDPPRSAEEELGDRRAPSGKGAAAITLAALGIVFGDIGTSPLYALQTVFTIDDRAVRPDQASVYGVISLVFWAVTLIVSIKYVTLIMRADNHGEGGIMALIALVRGVRVQRRIGKLVLVSLGIFGASLFYGDGMITPAISVLSAVEGIEVAAPGVESLVVPITLAILTVLFAVQRFGTLVVGRAFGPVMALWFSDPRASPGSSTSIEAPGDPARAAAELRDRRSSSATAWSAFLALGAVVLDRDRRGGAVRRHGPLRALRDPASVVRSVVFPALILNYMGQGALILDEPEGGRQPLLPAVPGSWAADADGGRRDGRGDHRLPGRDLRRVLGDPPGRCSWASCRG